MKYLFGLIALVFIGCSSNPLNIPDEIWNNMSEEKKIEAYQQQAQLNLQRELNRQKELELKEKEEQRQYELLEYKRANALYGDRLQCVVYDASANLSKSLRAIEPFAIDLLKNEIVEFKIQQDTSSSRRYHSYGYAKFEGQIIKLCQDKNLSSRCVSIVGTYMDFAKGLQTNINNHDFIVGKIRCEFVPTSGSNIIISR
ncbi:hypothetical protein [Arcobacter sp. FWKO B]|uniref:hypothetical protein n=1 Tax=Arcobacter sp. FWKO B TaxID=2593672 RepID=UPI0018A6450F|nr:hypothetical protein [Arcobacter sp. FWKO B]QOG12951.1 hypothetical protein FWKOB_09710 [Arcobacter sp. FWKO B]